MPGHRAFLRPFALPFVCVLLLLVAVAARAAPAGFSAQASASGPNHRLTLTATLSVGSGDRGKSGQLFVAAVLPGGAIMALTSAGWQIASGQLPAYRSVTLGDHTIALTSAVDASALSGTAIYAGYGLDYADMIGRAAYARIYTIGAPLAGASAAGDYLLFSINVQDFSYPEKSAATVSRIVDLHAKYRLPVDIYLSDTMLDLYQTSYPDVLAKLVASPYVGLNYHLRPPKPYYLNYDWAGLSSLPASEQLARIRNYESYVTDLATGQPTTRAGGYKLLRTLANARPGITAAFQVETALLDASAAAFRELGATWTLAHSSGVVNLGESSRGLYLRPEHYDLMLFQSPGGNAGSLIEAAFASAHAAAGARAPFVVGVKMHDNDFFAERSAWLTVFMDNNRRPPWDTSVKASLKSDADQAAQWAIYEAALAYADAQRARLGVANGAGLEQLRARGSATLHVSGTMHIESNLASWPNIDALIAFFRRATATGKVGNQATAMKWSIGADIDWLEKEPRAGEAIRTLSALGVEWDVHAHSDADRARCAERIVALGGVPTQVASGLIVTEIDGLRSAKTSSGGYTWQARTLWGIVKDVGHTTTSDDTAAGVWQPRTSADWSAHDPAGNLIAVGNGGRTLAAAETLANRIAAGGYVQPVYSVTLNVAPKTLTIVGTSDGIAQIEAWAGRVGTMSVLKWSTIGETAAAYTAAGSLPSRVNP